MIDQKRQGGYTKLLVFESRFPVQQISYLVHYDQLIYNNCKT